MNLIVMFVGFVICLIICAISYGIYWLADRFLTWMSAIGKDPHENLYDFDLPAKKHQK